MAGLEIIIDADKDYFDKKIKEVEYDIKKLSKEKAIELKAGLDTTGITNNIKDAKKSLLDLKNTLKDTGNSFSSMTPKVATGGNALMQFSRIAQDAPYGIIGIGNNLTATTEAFTHLKNQTGSTGGALKALANSFMGSGGILLGVSLLTTGLTLMAQKGLSVSDVFNKLTGNFNQFKQILSDTNSEASKNSASEISLMNANVAAAKNVKLEMSDRLIAVKELQNEFPAYFGNLTQEQILNGNVASAVKEVTEALIAKARASALSSKIGELAQKEFELREKETKALKEYNALNKEVKKGKFDTANSGAQAYQDALGNTNATNDAYSIAINRLHSQKSSLEEIRRELASNLALQNKYKDVINKNIASSLRLNSVKSKETTPKDTYSTPQVSPLKSKITPAGLEDLSGQIVQIAKEVQGAEGVISSSMKNINIAFDTSTFSALETLMQFNEDMRLLIEGALTGTFNALGDAIGNALSNGGNVFSSIAESLISSMGRFLSEMGSLLIKYGTLAIVKGKLDTAIKAGGIVSVGAGIAAIAVGIALKGVGSSIGNKANSSMAGGNNSSYSTGSSYSSPASYGGTSNFTFNGGNPVVFEISGQSLISVISNTLDKNQRLGGNNSII